MDQEAALEERPIDRSLAILGIVLSVSVSLIFSIIIATLWYRADRIYKPNEEQLVSSRDARDELQIRLKQTRGPSIEDLQLIPIGFLIQSLEFSSANEVYVTGLVWVTVPDPTVDNALPGDRSCGTRDPPFIFPESVKGLTTFQSEPSYTSRHGNLCTIGWYFDTTLRQPFDYGRFPLDHKTVWIRVWSKDFSGKTAFIPALDDYANTTIGATFGLDDDIVLDNWEIAETFFHYKTVTYDTSLGLHNRTVSHEVPELYFNVVLKRLFLNSFIIHLVPLFTVSALLFAVLMTLTVQRKNTDIYGFNINGIVGIVSALFFVVVLSHVQFRQQFVAAKIVYIEYFYFVMYSLLLLVTLNAFLIVRVKAIQWQDNLPAKLLYWPVTLGVLAIITYNVLEGPSG
jgi:hypothetical protein